MPRREVITCDEDDDIWEYNSQIVNKSKSIKKETGRQSAESAVSIKKEHTEIQSQQPKKKPVARKKNLKTKVKDEKGHTTKVKLEKGLVTPKNEKKFNFDRSGRCPVCQMPFTLLSVIETPTWHIDLCLEVPYSSNNECQYGIDCKNEFPNHYKKFRHKELARSQRKNLASQSDRNLGNMDRAKIQLNFDSNDNSVNGEKQEDICVIDLDSGVDSPNENMQPSSDKSKSNKPYADRKMNNQHSLVKTTASKTDNIGHKDLGEFGTVVDTKISIKIETQVNDCNFDDNDSDIIELTDIHYVNTDDDDDDISSYKKYNNNDDNGDKDNNDDDNDADDYDVDFVKVEPAELFCVNSDESSNQNIYESYSDNREVSDMLHDALSDNCTHDDDNDDDDDVNRQSDDNDSVNDLFDGFTERNKSYGSQDKLGLCLTPDTQDELGSSFSSDTLHQLGLSLSPDTQDKLGSHLSSGTQRKLGSSLSPETQHKLGPNLKPDTRHKMSLSLSPDIQDELGFSLPGIDTRAGSTVSSYKETPVNSLTDSVGYDDYISFNTNATAVENNDSNQGSTDSWKVNNSDENSGIESMCHKHFITEEKSNTQNCESFFARKILAKSRLKNENSVDKTIGHVTTLSYVGDKNNDDNGISSLASDTGFAVNIAESVKAGKRSATVANCKPGHDDVMEKKRKLEKLDLHSPLKNQKVQKHPTKKNARKVKTEPKSGSVYKSVASYFITKGKTPVTIVTDDESSDENRRKYKGIRCCENHDFTTESQESNISTSSMELDTLGMVRNSAETLSNESSKTVLKFSLNDKNSIGNKSRDNLLLEKSSKMCSSQSQEMKDSIQSSPGLVIQDVYSVAMDTSSVLPGGFISDDDNVCANVNGSVTNDKSQTGSLSQSSNISSAQSEPARCDSKIALVLKNLKSATQILMESSKLFYQKKSKLTSGSKEEAKSDNTAVDKGLVKQWDGKFSSSNPPGDNTWRRNKNYNKTNSATGSAEPSTSRTVQRNCPFYKKIPGTSFTVDAFKYGDIPGCKAYILSHFHYDHYIGLNKKFQNPIFCSKVTGNLVCKKIGVDIKYINTIPLNTPTIVENVEITLLEANHCPGAVLILFKLKSGKIFLHTGDFRACKEMELYPDLQNIHVDCLYLDTTYCDPQYDFPGQADVIKFTVKLALDTLSNNPKTLIVCGSYTIGKERIFMAIAQALNCKVCVTREKYNVLNCLEDEDWKRRLSLKWDDSGIHVLPMNKLNVAGLHEHLRSHGNKYNSILGIEPTGWTHSKKVLSLHHIKPKVKKENVTIYGVPYSEHSSFLEMKRFCQFIHADKILPTVNNGNVHSRRKMEVIFESWSQESHTSSKTVIEQKTLKGWMN